MAKLSFRRIEKKFIVDREQKEQFISAVKDYVNYDSFCVGNKTYNIQNIYYDTNNNTLISNSVDKPIFKQKLRARKYTGTNAYFLEIKMKYKGVVGKRRINISLEELELFNKQKVLPTRTSYTDKQIISEMNYLLTVYDIVPKTFISYDRLGFFWKDDPELRITFDSNICSSRENVKFDAKATNHLLDDGLYILEIKYIKNYPLWLVKILSELKIYPSSFSKYGTEFKKLVNGE